MRLARPYSGGLFKNVSAKTRTLDPETAVSCLAALGTHGQPARWLCNLHMAVQEVEREEDDVESGKRGKKRKVQELEYCYEQEMEGK